MASADQDEQDSIDAWNIGNPNLQAVTPQTASVQGYESPTSASAATVGTNAFNNVNSNTADRQAQSQALAQLQQTASNGGLNATDKAGLNQLAQQESAQNAGQQQAIVQNANQRGVGGSGVALAAELSAQQNAATNESNRDFDVAGQAQQRALQAMSQAGSLGTQMEAQQFGEQAQKAAAQNTISQFNAANTQQANLANQAAQNQAQQFNVTNKQHVADENMAAQNQASYYNSNLGQEAYQDQLARAQGLSGAYNNAAQLSYQESALPWQLVGGIINAGGQIGGGFARGYNDAHGGLVPGKARVPGDSLKNDTVPIMASPGEVVLPRSVVAHPGKAENFVREARGKQEPSHRDLLNHFTGGKYRVPPPVPAKPIPPPAQPRPSFQALLDGLMTTKKEAV